MIPLIFGSLLISSIFPVDLDVLNKLGGVSNIVASEGLVFFYGGKTYKLTGTFAPLNQLLGIFYE